MLGGLRYALLALKSQLLLVEDGAVVLLLGWGTGRLWEAVLAAKAVLSRDCRAGWVEGPLSLGTELSLICKGIYVLLLLKRIKGLAMVIRFPISCQLTVSWAFNIGLFCWRFNLMLLAADCWFQFAVLAWAGLADCWVNGGCRGDSCDALFPLAALLCWKLLRICWLICCCCGERRWPLFALNGFCWKSKKKIKVFFKISDKNIKNIFIRKVKRSIEHFRISIRNWNLNSCKYLKTF